MFSRVFVKTVFYVLPAEFLLSCSCSLLSFSSTTKLVTLCSNASFMTMPLQQGAVTFSEPKLLITR